jgi:hypothetical protein
MAGREYAATSALGASASTPMDLKSGVYRRIPPFVPAAAIESSGLSEALALEGKLLNIRVIAVSPGAVDTEMLRAAAPHLKAGMTPEQMARIVLFLVGPDAASLHGTNLEIYSNQSPLTEDGGLHLPREG